MFDATAVHWPSGYSVEWKSLDESSGLSVVAKQYSSKEEEAFRWDVFGGENTFILKLKDPKTTGLYYYFPETVGADANKTKCIFVPLKALMDCGWTHDPDNSTSGGCFGNDPGNAFKWIENHGGLPLTVDYGNYREINGRCKLNNIKPVAPIKGYVRVHNNMDAVKVALYHHGPLTVSIYTPPEFFVYTHGVFHCSEHGDLDHSVLLVGYGSLDGDDYWIIKNSWGRGWGLLGYALISTANNTLRLLDEVFHPIMK
ncbi:hypothetical protein GE061_002864 [Apolygus lucorum]|uniref:Peptidase C1A papain C-terminal domain-containing protein n=1 Tax=Apolygus lucorum TaxID=248454 RepID=A0A8S9X692_APOLU|nr:hypothetical protein GE061_002864 [Apolygus lucorum]